MIAACVPDRAAATLGVREVGTQRARVVGVFETPSGGHHEGLTLAEGQPFAAIEIEDEATLARVGTDAVCIDLVIRNAGSADFGAAIDAYELAMTIDGTRATTSLAPGTVNEHDGVVERHARVCAPAARARKVVIHTTHPWLGHRSSLTGILRRYELTFRWRIED